MKKSVKNLRAVLDSQMDFERNARKSVAWGMKHGLISQGSKADFYRQIVEMAKRRGWIKHGLQHTAK